MDSWHVLDIYDGDPTPGEPASIHAMAVDFQRRGGEANGHSMRLRSIGANSGALALRGDFATTIDRELAHLPGEAKALADAYLACAQALSAFANELAQVQAQSRSALQRGAAADNQYRNLLGQFCGLTGRRTYGPGIWRGLDESYAAAEREPVRTMVNAIGRSARLCEAERQEARVAALQAKGLYDAAAARCAAAIRAATLTSTRLSAGRRRQPASGASQNATTERIPGPAGKRPQLPPHHRHNLERVQPGSRTKGANTVVLPGTDVAKDVDDINSGRATWDAGRQRYVVNGRTYIAKDGRVVPESGPGLEALDHQEYTVLKAYIQYDGDLDAAIAVLSRDPNITPAHRARALEIFRHHSKYRG
ncbi:hypothetical protein [Micromonospora foliorum]|uniref:hypothetical protein n=1 Tax=Micromonospora foliorum TaxID=2911210 RepID=UPI001EE7FF6B|nr:hypothetical protein [Micromonospora foliorum]MCG5436398.1 hypothetical protein [Micromonospora foliorum]